MRNGTSHQGKGNHSYLDDVVPIRIEMNKTSHQGKEFTLNLMIKFLREWGWIKLGIKSKKLYVLKT